jgi:hypothetical protein
LKDTTSLRDLGPRREQLAADGATLAVHRPDASSIARIGSLSPARPVVTKPEAVRPGASTPVREPFAPRRLDMPIDQAKLTTPSSLTPGRGPAVTRPSPSSGGGMGKTLSGSSSVAPGPAAGNRDANSPSRPQSMPASTTGGTSGSGVGGSVAKPGQSIVMRNPNPNRNSANRPVTYPYIPATQTPATAGPSGSRTMVTPSGPNQGPGVSQRSTFVPGPPPASARSTYNVAPTPGYGPAANYSARPSYSTPASSHRSESSRPAVSAPSPSSSGGGNSSSGHSGGGQSSSRSSDSGGSASRGGSVQVGRVR